MNNITSLNKRYSKLVEPYYKSMRNDKELASIKTQIETLKKTCKHPKSKVKSTHGGNTGNYDGDTYWEDQKCSQCGKSRRITTDMSPHWVQLGKTESKWI
jgi:truncated hemoglobin YjbI